MSEHVLSPPSAPWPGPRAWHMAALLPLSDIGAEIACVIALVPILLLVAFWNGFPFTFFDTGAYVLQGLALRFVPERAATYSLFLRVMDIRESLWLAAAAQSLLSSFMIVQFARAQSPRLPAWKMLAFGLGLVLLTGAGWYVGQIEPDCFTPLAAIALYLLAFKLDALGVGRAIAIVLIGAFAISAHPSNLGMAAGLALAIAALGFAAALLRGVALPEVSAKWPLAALAGGLAIVLASNFVITGQVFLSRSGSVFFTARLIQDGVIGRVLDDECATAHFRLCTYRGNLPPTADDWLWAADSSFNKLGRFKGMERESQILVRESLEHYPLRVLSRSLVNGIEQFAIFRTGDGVGPQRQVQNWLFAGFLHNQQTAYLRARQEEGGFPLLAINIAHVGLAALALAILAFAAWTALRRGDWRAAALPSFILLSLALNAFVCGAISGPHDRYQGRLIWIAPLAVALLPRDELMKLLRARQSA